MEIEVLTGVQAIEFIPKYVKSKNSTVITPIYDHILSNSILGHLILSRDTYYGVNHQNNIVLKNINISSTEIYFLFIGTNPTFFNYLFNDKITGIFNQKLKRVEINSTMKGLVSFELKKIIHDYIIKFYL